MNVKFYLIATALVSMMSCSPKQGNSTGSGQSVDYSLATLEEVEPCLIPLDSMTSQETNYLQLINDSTLAFMNKPAFNICLVNLRDMSTSKIQLHQEGPHAINYVESFCYLNPDSIWIFESVKNNMTLVDSEGVVKQRLQLPRTDKNGKAFEYAVYPFTSTLTPYKVQGSKHILLGMTTVLPDGQKPGVTLIYNTENDSVATGNPYPAVYDNTDDFQNWNVMGHRLTHYAIMPDGNLLTCFPASDSLYAYNPGDGTRTAYFAGHKGGTDIHAASVTDYEAGQKSYVTQYAYQGVLYDSTEGAYYRFIRHPFDDFSMDNLRECFTKKPISVIILDDKMNVIGETLLPEELYYPGLSFVNSDGLHINVESEDDDFMKFRVFKLRR